MMDISNLPCAVCGASLDYTNGGTMRGEPLHICSKSGCSAFTDRKVDKNDAGYTYLCSGHWEAFQLRVKVGELQKEIQKLRKELRHAKS
jgi:hypothetical protein